MNVIEIVHKYLEDNNFDGLCGEECGCDLEELAPCDSESALSCVPGYKVPKTSDDGAGPGDWEMRTTRENIDQTHDSPL